MFMGPIEIDGSYGEGGGQIVRTACCFAAVTRKACRVFNIRRARRVPGLRPQHLACVHALAQLCDARLEGGRVDSLELTFSPQRLAARDLTVRIETAGSITLALQALLPAVAAARKPMTIELDGGGTDTARAPTLDYLRHVFLWFLRRIGVHVELNVLRRGYYPRGGAAVRAQVSVDKLDRFELLGRGSLGQVTFFSQAARVLKARRVAERQIDGARSVLDTLRLPVRSNVDYEPSLSAGSSLCIVAEYADTVIGSDAVGARGRLAEDIGKEAAKALLPQFRSTACLDRHMADQIIPYLALAGDRSSATVYEVTSHCLTNIWVIEKFLDGRFQVRDNTITWAAG